MKIALYENRILKATANRLKGDKYEVSLTVKAGKMYVDEKGNEAEAATTNDYIDIEIFAEDKVEKNGRKLTQPLYLKKHRFKNTEFTLQFKVKGKPVKAGIDPYKQLIDRIPEDNKIEVEIK